MSPPVGRGNHAVRGMIRRMSPVTSGAGDVERRSEKRASADHSVLHEIDEQGANAGYNDPDTFLRPEVKCWAARGDCDGFRSERSIGEGKDNRR